MANNTARPSASIFDLPENCVSHVLSLMTPGEVCRSSAVSTSFQSAANSDYVWDRILPPDLPAVLSRAVSPISFSSKKELFFRLFSSPLVIDSGKRVSLSSCSFSVAPRTAPWDRGGHGSYVAQGFCLHRTEQVGPAGDRANLLSVGTGCMCRSVKPSIRVPLAAPKPNPGIRIWCLVWRFGFALFG